ncbi:hypothetical protein BGW38_005661, partial [Lunasporangiospora selenospora]
MDDGEDFPFSFGASSDGEETGDDGLFCAPKPKADPHRVVADKEPYLAQVDTDGWFHHTGQTVEEQMLQDKNGATKVKMRADHFFMLHQYQEAYDVAREYCRVVSINGTQMPHNTASADGGLRSSEPGVLKVTDSREMQEMALRCALKLKKLDNLSDLVEALTSQETGIVFLKAKAYMVLERFDAAATILVHYQKSRSSNYSVWRLLSDCFSQYRAQLLSDSVDKSLQVSPTLHPDSDTFSQTSLGHFDHFISTLALLCILRARHLMKASTWSQVDYARARYYREMSVIEKTCIALEQDCHLETKIESSTLENDTATATAPPCSSPSTVEQDDASALASEQYKQRSQEYEQKILEPAQAIFQAMKEKPLHNNDTPARDTISLEVIEFVLSAWDSQVIEPDMLRHHGSHRPTEDPTADSEHVS